MERPRPRRQRGAMLPPTGLEGRHRSAMGSPCAVRLCWAELRVRPIAQAADPMCAWVCISTAPLMTLGRLLFGTDSPRLVTALTHGSLWSGQVKVQGCECKSFLFRVPASRRQQACEKVPDDPGGVDSRGQPRLGLYAFPPGVLMGTVPSEEGELAF